MTAWSTLQWNLIQLLLVFLLVYPKRVVTQLSRDPEELLNWCLDGQNHKVQPGPEDELHSHCMPWANHSCCTTNTTHWIHQSDFNMYNFNWDHCAVAKPMSDSCRKAFIKDLCFYECEPHLGAWGVKDKKKMRNERFVNVPVCATDCDIWYSSCKEDFTCVSNWSKNFAWKGGINICPVNSVCRPFSEVFGDSKTFCENVWDGSFKYTPEGEPCMRLWFNGSTGNPNREVARVRIRQLQNAWAADSSSCNKSRCLLGTMLAIVAFIKCLL